MGVRYDGLCAEACVVVASNVCFGQLQGAEEGSGRDCAYLALG